MVTRPPSGPNRWHGEWLALWDGRLLWCDLHRVFGVYAAAWLHASKCLGSTVSYAVALRFGHQLRLVGDVLFHPPTEPWGAASARRPNAEQIVLEGEIEAGTAGIALAPARPRSWLSMRRESCRSVPRMWSPPNGVTSSCSLSVTSLYFASAASHSALGRLSGSMFCLRQRFAGGGFGIAAEENVRTAARPCCWRR